MTGGGDKACAGQDAVGIEVHVALQEIVVRISVDQRRDVRTDQAFLAIGDIGEGVKHIDRLLFVFREALPRRIERERARQARLTWRTCVFTRVRWPSGETGALTMRSENPFWSMFATSNTSKPPGPFAV